MDESEDRLIKALNRLTTAMEKLSVARPASSGGIAHAAGNRAMLELSRVMDRLAPELHQFSQVLRPVQTAINALFKSGKQGGLGDVFDTEKLKKKIGDGFRKILDENIFPKSGGAGGAKPPGGGAAAAEGAESAAGAGAEAAGGAAGGAEAAGGAGAAGAAGGAEAAGAGGAALASNPVGWAIAAVVAVAAVTVAIVELGPAVKGLTKGVLESQRKLAEVSASMAAVFASEDVRNVFRNMEKGEKTSNSAQFLSNQSGNLADSTQRIEILLQNIENYALGSLAWMTNQAIKPLVAIVDIGNTVIELIERIPGVGNKDDEDYGPGAFFEAVKNQVEANRQAGKQNLQQLAPQPIPGK